MWEGGGGEEEEERKGNKRKVKEKGRGRGRGKKGYEEAEDSAVIPTGPQPYSAIRAGAERPAAHHQILDGLTTSTRWIIEKVDVGCAGDDSYTF
ncbi:hypothetical protein Tco_0635313 [Tanacetum coccineum]